MRSARSGRRSGHANGARSPAEQSKRAPVKGQSKQRPRGSFPGPATGRRRLEGSDGPSWPSGSIWRPRARRRLGLGLLSGRRSAPATCCPRPAGPPVGSRRGLGRDNAVRSSSGRFPCEPSGPAAGQLPTAPRPAATSKLLSDPPNASLLRPGTTLRSRTAGKWAPISRLRGESATETLVAPPPRRPLFQPREALAH